MADQQDDRVGRLEGDELKRARTLRANADKDIHEMAEMIGRSLGYEPDGKRLTGAVIKFDNDTVTILQGGRCWVHEDPPGECRSCTPEEKHGMETILSE